MKISSKRASQLAAVVVTGLLGTQALAANTESMPEERRGALIGGIIGASVGGPIGAGAGAILGGGVIGKAIGLGRENRELGASLSQARAETHRVEQNLSDEVAHLQRDLARAQAERQVADLRAGVPIQFRTASSEIEHHYQPDLADIARILSQMPDARVSLAGYADRRGDVDYNQKLSEARVDEVRSFLIERGVSPSQVVTEAFGETRPVSSEESAEADFFDRRVVVTFSLDAGNMGDAARPVATR